MESLDYYQELEITKTASTEEIKSSYKKLALKWHPDKNKGNEESATLKFQKISEAYAVLSDPKKKERYDKYGTCNDDDFDFNDFMSHMNFEDLFGSLFGGLSFTFGDVGGGMNFPKDPFRGRSKNRANLKSYNKRMEKDAMRAMKEFAKFDFGDADDFDDFPTKKKEKKTESEDEWDTEEEFTDEEDDDTKEKKDKKDKDNDDDDDDYEDVDSSDEDVVKGSKKNGGFGDDFGNEDIFMFTMFVTDNTIEMGKKLKCKFDNKIYKNMNELLDHFEECHRKEYLDHKKKMKF